MIYSSIYSHCVYICYSIDSKDDDNYTPLHIASRMGHTAIVVALIEEGNASINERGGEKGDTPLMQSVRTRMLLITTNITIIWLIG